MSTRATIAVRRADQVYDAVYLHFDGYPEHTGEILMQHHGTQESARKRLVAGGDLRCLDRRDRKTGTLADRDPPATMPTREALIDFARNCGAQFVYVFDDGAWSCKEL